MTSMLGDDRQSRSRPSRICVDPLMMIVVFGLGGGLIVLSTARHPTRAAISALALFAGGALCLTLAKTSLWRQGIWTSWGSSRMTKGYARVYKWGWILLGAGFLLMLVAWRGASNRPFER